ncbi:MAG: LPS export ABC transporter permease LptF [Candidatus Omnitrophota bacterium]
MRIIRNYILRECLLPFLMSVGVLSCVFLLGYTVKLAHMVINKGVPLISVAKVFLLLIPVLLAYTIPLACLVGVMLAFSRLTADNEIIAIRASGIRLNRLVRPLFAAGLLLSLFTFWLNDRVIPQAYHQQKLLQKNLGAENPAALLEPGVFIDDFEGQTVFIHRVEGNKFYNITIWQPQPEGRPPRTIIAKRGEFTKTPDGKKIVLKLIEGTTDESDPSDPSNYYKLNFKTLFITLDLTSAKSKIQKKPKGMTIHELTAKIHDLEQRLIETEPLRTELYRRVTWSFAPLIFILLGFPLAVMSNRRERSANVLIAIMAAAIYYLLSLGAQALSIEGVAPPELIMWVPNLAAILALLYYNARLCAS